MNSEHALVLPERLSDLVESLSLSFQIMFLPIMALERYIYICRPTEVDTCYSKKRRIAIYILSGFVATFAGASSQLDYEVFKVAVEMLLYTLKVTKVS